MIKTARSTNPIRNIRANIRQLISKMIGRKMKAVSNAALTKL